MASRILSGARLLNAASGATDSAKAIVAAAVAGELTEKTLSTLLHDYAVAVSADTHRGELRQRSERLFTEAFHRSLRTGCTDELLSSLRPQFDEHAEKITAAMTLIPPTGSAENFWRPRNRPLWPPGRDWADTWRRSRPSLASPPNSGPAQGISR